MHSNALRLLSGLVSRRAVRSKAVKAYARKHHLEFFAGELEKRQLLASFSYSSGLLTIQTDSASEQLSILSSSESGNYTLTTTGTWTDLTGSASGFSVSGNSLYVNQPGSLASILINDNSGAVSGSSLSFGASSANFVNNLTVNFANATGCITLANTTSFTAGNNLSLTANLITLVNSVSTQGAQSYNGNIWINGNVTLASSGGAIQLNGPVSRALTYQSTYNTFTSNATWTVPSDVSQADVLVVGGGGGGGGLHVSGGGGGGQVVSQSNVSVSGSVGIVVGSGGVGGTGVTPVGSTGANSTFGNITALGGGGGAGNLSSGPTNGWTGGGGSGDAWSGAIGVGGVNYKGGDGYSYGLDYGGGGGGAGGPGSSGTVNITGGPGGTGASSNITGNVTFYGGGGGGGGNQNGNGVAGPGGTGGGGNGGFNSAGVAGTPNTGGGGGGSSSRGSANGGAGGSGIVIVKYMTNLPVPACLSINTGGGVTVFSNSVALDGLSITGPNLSLPAMTVGNLTVNATTGDLTQAGPANVTGTATIQATACVILNNATNQFSLINSNGTNIQIGGSGNIGLGTVSAIGGDITVVTSQTAGCISVSGPVSVTGANQISLTGRNILVNNATLTSVSGNITLLADNNTTQVGGFVGVCITGAAANISTSGGNVNITGRGGAGSSRDYGINLVSNASINTGGNGGIILNGVSGNGSGGNEYGICLDSGYIATANGIISLTGKAWGSAGDSHGVDLRGTANVSAGGAGTITITGNVACGSTNGYGIYSGGSGNIITTNGSITLNGKSSATDAASTRGIYVVGGIKITAGGTGTIDMTGDTANVSTTRTIDINDGSLRTSGWQIVFNTNSLNMGSSSSVNATLAGEVIFQNSGTGSFTVNNLTANSLTLNSVNGAISVTGISNIANGVNLSSTGNIAIASISANGGNIQASTNQSTSCISLTGALSTIGSGVINLSGRNIVVTGNISTALGNIILTGNGAESYQLGSFDGVRISGVGMNVNTTGGNIAINGRGSSGSTFSGVNITQTRIFAGGGGFLSITGVSSNGTSTERNFGVWLNTTTVSTFDGNINIFATSNGTGSDSHGFRVQSSNVTSSGNGSITIEGVSGTGANNEYGILIKTSGIISTANGTITTTGRSRGTASSSYGIHYTDSLNMGFNAGGTQGSISLTGITANASATGLNLNNGNVSVNGGLITLNANSLNIGVNARVNTTANGNVVIQTLGAKVNLGGADDSANLGLTQAEIANITAGCLTIGNSTSGAIVITAPVSRSNATLGTNLTLISGSSISQTSGNLAVSGTSNLISGGCVTLGNSTNDFGTLSACGTNVSISDSNSIVLGSISATSLTVSSNGAISQTAAISITSDSNYTSSGSITFDQPSNQLGNVSSNGTMVISAGNLTSLNATSGSVAISGTANVTGLATMSVNLNLSGGTINTLLVTTGTSNISGGSVTGLANVTGGTLVSSRNLGSLNVGASGTANLTGGSVSGATVSNGTLNINGTLAALTVNAGNTTVQSAGNVTGPVSSLGGYLTINRSGQVKDLALTGTNPTVQNNGTINNDVSIISGCLTLLNGSTQAGNFTINGGQLISNATIGGILSIGGVGSSAQIQASGIVSGTTNVSTSGQLSSAGSLQALSITGGSANVATGSTVTGATTVSAGSLTTNGTLSGGLVATGATVYTNNTGTTAGSNLTLGSGSTLNASGSNISTYGQIAASSVTINNATLALSPSFTLANESAFTIIDNTGGSAVSGTFNGLPEGSIISAGGNNLTISYQGGTGHNNVVLYNTGGLSTVVNSNLDISNPSDNVVTLREAVEYARLIAANSGAPQAISFNLFNGTTANTITLSNATDYGVISVGQNSTLSINGPVATSGKMLTISGGGVTGIFNLATPTNISNMTLSNGTAYLGGAIFNNSTLTLTSLTFQDNTAIHGGGVWNDTNGNLTITNSTLANNTASNFGGAIENNGGTITLSQSTIAFNQAGVSGGGIDNGGTVFLTNTIIANNTGTYAPDMFGGVYANFSLIGDTTNNPVIGSNNKLDVIALLGALDYYGGNTRVFPLLPGSPAINSGDGSNATDQRGITVAGQADMGSFQSRGFNITKTGGGGTNQVAVIGTAFPAPLSLNINSTYGEPVAGGVISYTFANETGGGTSANDTGFTPVSATIGGSGANGNVSITAVANSNYSASRYTALADATGANAPASYLLKNVGLPASMTIVGNNNQTIGFNSNFTPVTVTVRDSLQNEVPFVTVNFSSNSTLYGATARLASNSALSTWSGQTDINGNVTSAIFKSNAVGGAYGLSANSVAGSATAQYRLVNLQPNIQNGTAGRSFLNAVAGMFGNSTLAQELLTNNRVKIEYLGYSGENAPVTVSVAANGTANGSGNISWSYGANGITGNPNSQDGDGVYQLAVNYDGTWSYVKFHRLFGDTNGDSVVDTLDYNVVINPAVYGKLNIVSGANTNGVGQVYTKDVTTVLRQRGRRVSYSAY